MGRQRERKAAANSLSRSKQTIMIDNHDQERSWLDRQDDVTKSDLQPDRCLQCWQVHLYERHGRLEGVHRHPESPDHKIRIRGIAMEENGTDCVYRYARYFPAETPPRQGYGSGRLEGAEDGDVLLLVHDCARAKIDQDTAAIVAQLAELGVTASLVLNKIDLAAQNGCWSALPKWRKQYEFERIFMVSAEQERD